MIEKKLPHARLLSISIAAVAKAAHEATAAVPAALAPRPPSTAPAASLTSGRSHLHSGTRHCVLHPSRLRDLHPGSLGGGLSSALPLPLLRLLQHLVRLLTDQSRNPPVPFLQRMNWIHPPQLCPLLILKRNAVTWVENNEPPQPVGEQEVLVVVPDFLQALPDAGLEPVLKAIRRMIRPAAVADIQVPR